MMSLARRWPSILWGGVLALLLVAFPRSGIAQGFRRYTVAFGDTPARIAERFGISVEQLLAANGLPTDAILHPGDELILPTRLTAAEHTVRPGETLAEIATRYDVPQELIAYHNGLWRTDRIYAGQVLLIPAVNKTFEGLATRALRVLSPLPGATVKGELILQGVGASPDNVILITVVDARGKTLLETWAPIWAEIGQPGRFTAKLDVQPYGPGQVILVIWNRNLHDGTPREKVSLPLTLSAP